MPLDDAQDRSPGQGARAGARPALRPRIGPGRLLPAMVARSARVRRYRAGLAACVMLSVLGAMAVLAPWISPQDPLAQNRADQFKAPSLPHPFGTDEFGRDILSRVIHGARISLLTGAVAVLIGADRGRAARASSGGFAGGLDRRGDHARARLPAGDPGHPTRDGHHRDSGPRVVQRDAGGRRGEHPLVRASHPRQHPLAEGAGVRRRNPGARSGPRVPHVPDDPAQRPDAHRGPGRGDGRGGHAPRGGALVPRARHPAADALVGLDAEHRPVVPPPGAVVRALPRHRDHAVGPLPQRAGRCAPERSSTAAAPAAPSRRSEEPDGALRPAPPATAPAGALSGLGGRLADDLPDPRRSRDRAARRGRQRPSSSAGRGR